MKPVGRHQVGFWIPEEEWEYLVTIAAKHNVSVSLYLHGIVKDALHEEGITLSPQRKPGRPFVQRQREERCPERGEGSEASGDATS